MSFWTEIRVSEAKNLPSASRMFAEALAEILVFVRRLTFTALRFALTKIPAKLLSF